jgi:excisionase family DNA binding protein
MNDDVPRGSFTVREFAHAQRLGYVKTYELVMAGRVRSYTVGRRRLIPASELIDFPRRELAEQERARAE